MAIAFKSANCSTLAAIVNYSLKPSRRPAGSVRYTAIGQELGISEVQSGPDLTDHEETDIASISATSDRAKMGHSDASQIPSYRPIVV